jgi:DNA-binding CsgD family transcriptional regulator
VVGKGADRPDDEGSADERPEAADVQAADDHVGQPEDEHRDEEPGDTERDDREREREELEPRLDERREQPENERGEDKRPGRSTDRNAAEDPGCDREGSGIDGPGDENTERERHAAIVAGNLAGIACAHEDECVDSPDPRSEIALVGRESELAELERFVATSERRSLVLHGEPGIGKTTLWEAGVAHARARGHRVLSARGTEAEAQLSFAGLSDLLEGVDLENVEGTPEPQCRALAVALRRAEPAGVAAEPLAVYAGFLSVVRLLAATERVTIAVDDIQTLDAPSVDTLVFAARRLGESDVRFLLSRRSGRRSPLESTLSPQHSELLAIGPLSFGAISGLLFDRLGRSLPRRVTRTIYEMSEGNPLFALELGRAVSEQGSEELGVAFPLPDVFDDLFVNRVAGLSEPVRRVLLAVALGGNLTRSEIVAVVDPLALEDALSAGVISADGARLRPSHPLLAAAATRASSALERRDIHLGLANAVLEPALGDWHRALAASSPDVGLAAEIAAAAARATERGAIHDAVELADHALRLTPPTSADHGERVIALATLLRAAGDTARCAELVEQSIDLLPPGRLRGEGWLLLAEGSWDLSIEEPYRERALDESRDDPTLRARVLGERAVLLAVGRVERLTEAEAVALEAVEAAALGGDALRRALVALAWVRVMRGHGIDDLRAREPSGPPRMSLAECSLDRPAGVRLAFRGDLDAARAKFRRLFSLSDERGEATFALTMILQLCELELRAGNIGGADRLLHDREHWLGLDIESYTDHVRARLAAVLAAVAGDPARALRAAATVLESGSDSLSGWDRLEATRAIGIAALFEQDLEQAVESLRSVWEHTEREGIDDPGAFPVAGDLVEALAASAEIAEAEAVTRRVRELAVEQEHPWGLTTADRCEAVLQFQVSYSDEAAQALDKAAATYADLGLRFDAARTLLFLGRAQRRGRKRADGRRTLQRAEELFSEGGSQGWADQARSELERISGRRAAGDGSLTPSEQRVAELASSGLSNKEIAARLVVSVYTVETQLKYAYAKLGIRSRAQLAGRLAATR